jgi:fatty acid desaturase
MTFMRQRYHFSKSIQDQLSELRGLDNWHGLIAAFYDYGVIAFGAALFYLSPWFYPLSILLIGSRQRAFATLLHESVHSCLAKSRFLNRLLGTYMSGYLIFQEYNTYRDSHVKRHHAFLGDKEKDPDYTYHLDEKIYNYHGCFNFFKL